MAEPGAERPKISLAKKRPDPTGISLDKHRDDAAREVPAVLAVPVVPPAEHREAPYVDAPAPAVVIAPEAAEPVPQVSGRNVGERNVLVFLGAAILAVVVVAAVAVVAIVGMNSRSTTGGTASTPVAATETTATPSQSPSPSTSPTSAVANDPLGVGMPLANVGCDSKYLLILDSTDVTSEYVPKLEAAHDAAAQAKYLRTDGSCSGFNQTGSHGGTVYAAYLGPFSTVDDACAARADTGLPLAYVKLLSSSAKARSLCACTTSVSELPVLDSETDYNPTPARGQAVADLQALLYRAGVNKLMVIGGHFRESTHGWVVAYQQQAGLDVTGMADAQTWQSLKDNYC